MTTAGTCTEGCYIDTRRDADSAAWTCARCGGNVCMGCQRPIEAGLAFCGQRDCAAAPDDPLDAIEPFDSDAGDRESTGASSATWRAARDASVLDFTARRTQGEPAPGWEVVPENVAPEQKNAASKPPAKRKVSFYQDAADSGRMRAAVRCAIRHEEGRGLSHFIQLAVMREVERVEGLYNNGEPFGSIPVDQEKHSEPATDPQVLGQAAALLEEAAGLLRSQMTTSEVLDSLPDVYDN